MKIIIVVISMLLTGCLSNEPKKIAKIKDETRGL